MPDQTTRDGSFILSLAPATAGSLSADARRPSASNLQPLRVGIRAARNGHTCRYTANYGSGEPTLPEEETRIYIQIWELDRWTRTARGRSRRQRGTEQDSEAQGTGNELLEEISGFIIRPTGSRTYRFVTDKNPADAAAPGDRSLGQITIRFDHLESGGQVADDGLTLIVPIRGEAETTLEIGVSVRRHDEEQDFTDADFPLPVYHIVNLSKIIEDQLAEGGLRVIAYTNYNRRIDMRAHQHYQRVRRQLLSPDTPARRQELHLPASGNAPPAATLRDWLSSLGGLYTGGIPSAATTSTRTLYAIQNDTWFPNGARMHAGLVNAICLDENGQLAVGRTMILGRQNLLDRLRALVDAVYSQHMNSSGDKPQILKLAIWCHGIRNYIKTGGRNPEHDLPDGGDQGEHLRVPHVPAFVNGLVVSDRGLLCSNAVVGLYACNAARSRFTTGGTNSDNTYGEDPPAGHVLGEESLARALWEGLRANTHFNHITVWGHTTRGPADTNPYVRVFTSGTYDLINLVYDESERPYDFQDYRSHRDQFREVMLLHPDAILPGFEGPPEADDPIVALRDEF